MGRVKIVAVKMLGNNLLSQHSDRFGETFEENKRVLGEVKPIASKRIRNIVAGYITHKVKSRKRLASLPQKRSGEAGEESGSPSRRPLQAE